MNPNVRTQLRNDFTISINGQYVLPRSEMRPKHSIQNTSHCASLANISIITTCYYLLLINMWILNMWILNMGY